MSKSVDISEVEVVPIKPQDGLVAFASCVLDSNWYIGSIAVYTRPEGGYRLVYPTKKVDGEDVSVVHPINKEVGDKMEKVIGKKVKELCQKTSTHKK
jgi:stage V sporulation protein G